MADPKRQSLTVLGGSMCGTRFVIEESQENIALGSDESCDFRIPLPGVAGVHARILMDGSTVVLYDAGSGSGLHVNDNPVLDTGTPLRNGDIVWLGSPGEPEVVMLQCVLPRAIASAASSPVPEAAPAEDETLALAPETLFSADPVPHAEPATEVLDLAREVSAEPATEMLDIAREAMGEPPPEEEAVPETISLSAPEPPPEPEEPMLEPPPTTVLSAPDFEDETTETPPSVTFPEETPGTVIVDAGEMGSPSFGVPAEEPTVFYSG